MAKSQSTSDYLRRVREEGPEWYKNVPDELLYWKMSERGEDIPIAAKWQEQEFQPVSQIIEPNQNEDLGFFASLSDWWIDDNSYDFMKGAYNRSLTGTAEKLLNGESRYDVDESDFNIAEDIGATLFSFLMPLDILTMGAGGFIGGKVANAGLKRYIANNSTSKAAQAMKYSKKGISQNVGRDVAAKGTAAGLDRKARKEMVDKAIEGAQKSYKPLGDKSVVDVLSTSQRALLGGLQQAPALGLYEAALTGMHYEMEGKSFLEGAAWGAFHGGILGGLTGAIGGGMGAVQSTMFGKAGGKTRQDLGLKNYLKARGAYGLPGQIAAESSLFSGVELVERVHAGEDIQGKDVLHTFARNIGLFGALKTQGILTKKTLQKINETKSNLSKDYNEWKEKKTKEALEDVMDNISETETVKGGERVASKTANQEKFSVSKDDIANKEKYKDLKKRFDEDVSKKLFDENGEIKDNILNMPKDNIAKFVYETNNYLMSEITAFKELLKNNKIDTELRKQAEESLAKMEKVKKLLDDKFADRSWMKSKEAQMTVGGQTREQAKASWSDSVIKEKAKDYKVLNIKEKDGKITNKDEVIDAIYESKREKQQFKKDLARPQKGIKYEQISEDVQVQKFLDKTEDSGINIGEKRGVKEKRKAEAINDSGLSTENKNILADAVVKEKRNTLSPKSLKETIDLFNYLEKKKGVKNIKNLTKEEFQGYVADYVNSKLGYEMVSKKTGKIKKETTIFEDMGGDSAKTHTMRTKYNTIYQNLIDSFGSLKNKNRLATTLGFNPVLEMGVKAIKGRKTITIPGGRDSVVGKDSMSSRLEKSDKVYKIDGKEISSYEAHVIVEILNSNRMRGKELPFDLVITKELLNSGKFKTLAKAGGKEVREVVLDAKTLKKIRELVRRKGLKEGDRLFSLSKDPKKGNTQGNKLFKEIFKDLPEDMQPLVYDRQTGEYAPFKKGEKLPGGIDATRGIKPMDIFRRMFEGEDFSLKEQSSMRGQSHSKSIESYRAPKPERKPKKSKLDTREYQQVMDSAWRGDKASTSEVSSFNDLMHFIEMGKRNIKGMKSFKDIGKIPKKFLQRALDRLHEPYYEPNKLVKKYIGLLKDFHKERYGESWIKTKKTKSPKSSIDKFKIKPSKPRIRVHYKKEGISSAAMGYENRMPKVGESASRMSVNKKTGKVTLKAAKEIRKVEQKDGETFLYFKGEKKGVLLKDIILQESGLNPIRAKKKAKPKTKRKTQVDMGKVKEGMEIGVERQESMKELILEGSSGRKEAYKNLKIKLGQKLKKEGGEKVLGQIEGHTIKIAEGKVKIDTIPHEVSHYVVDVLKAFGTKADKALIKRGIKMFKSEEALVQRMGEYAANQLTTKSLIGKAKIWAKAFNARLKDFFGFATKEDVAYIMSRRVVKGNIPQGRKVANYISRMETHYQKESNFKTPNVQRVAKLEKKLEGKVDKEVLINAKERFGIDKKNPKDWTDGATNDYVEFLESVNKSKEASTQNKTSFLDEWINQYQVSKEEAFAIADGLGRVDGNYNKLSKSGKALFAEQVMIDGSVAKEITSSQTHAQALDGFKIPHSLKRAIMPTYYVLQKYGGTAGKAIADKLLKFEVVSDSFYKGKGDVAISLIKKELGGKNNLVWMFDTERVDKMISDGINKKKTAVRSLTKAEYDFYLKTKDKNGKEITHKTKDSDIVTKEGKAKQVHAKLMNFYWESMQREVKGVTNKSEYAQFQKEFKRKFVEGYFSRRISKDALEHFVSGKNAENLEGLIDKNIKESAKRKVKDSNPNLKDKTKIDEKVKELVEDIDFRNSVGKDILNMITHKHHKVKNKHLMERGPLIDEFITIKDMKTGKDKVIRVYETDLSSTVEPYVMTMSKYLATIRFFPEYTGLGGRYKIDKTSLNNLEIMMHDKTLGAYAIKAIQKTIGFKGEDPLLSDLHSGLAKFSHMSAAMGLSSPTSGLKNLMIGIPRSIASFGFMNTGKGIIKLFDSATWDKAREKGILEYGAKHLELGQAKLTDRKGLGWASMENLFKYVNFMTPTENFNRIISHEAGLLYFQNQLNVLHGGRGLFGEKSASNAKRLMRDMFKFSESDIKFLGSKEVKNLAFKSKESQGRYEYLIRQAGHFSHVSAQGGTSTPLLPLWASGATAKPLTLFQRMAYSTTFDSYVNYYKPIVTHKNFMPLARALAMHTLSGGALYMFYQGVFGKEPPESGGDALDKMTMYLHRSEMLGLAGFLFSPYDEGMFQSLSQPVIARNAMEALRQFNHVTSGRDDIGNAIKNWTLKSVVSYNQFDQLVFKNSDEYKLMKKVRNYRMQFADDYPSFKKTSVDAYSERTYYYRDLKDALYFGDDKKITKNYFAAYNFIVSELEEINSSPKWRHKKAKHAIKQSLKSMNPVSISDRSTGRNMSKKKMFLDWVKKNLGKDAYKDVLKSEKHYEYQMRNLKKLLKNKGVWKGNSVYSSLNLF